MEKIYTVIAHCSDGDVAITPKGTPIIRSLSLAEEIVEAHKQFGVSLEIVREWDCQNVLDVLEDSDGEEWESDLDDLSCFLSELLEKATQRGDSSIDFVFTGLGCSLTVCDDTPTHQVGRLTVETLENDINVNDYRYPYQDTIIMDEDWFYVCGFGVEPDYDYVCPILAKMFLNLIEKVKAE